MRIFSEITADLAARNKLVGQSVGAERAVRNCKIAKISSHPRAKGDVGRLEIVRANYHFAR